MDDRMQAVEHELAAIKERNARVEAEKAWEVSLFRVLLLTVLTYVVSSVVFIAIGDVAPFREALIPAIGYFLSMRSIPFIKRYWITRRLADTKN